MIMFGRRKETQSEYMQRELAKEIHKVSKGRIPADEREYLAKRTVERMDYSDSIQMHKGLRGYAEILVQQYFQNVMETETTPDRKEPGVSYLIAKRYSGEGCFAVKTESGKALAYLVSYLNIKTLDKGIQILTVSSPDMYGEYKPYHFLDSEKEFISKVFEMMGD